MSFDNVNFTSNPNFKFKEIVIEKTECLAATYQFDVFKDKDGETYLISPYWNIEHPETPIHHISIINLKNNKLHLKLEGHQDRVLTVRFFQNPYTGKNYLISADRKYRVIVWNLSNNGEQIFNEEVKYESFLYSSLLMFEESGLIYAVTSTLSNGETFVFTVDEEKKKEAVPKTKDISVYFLAYWWDKNKKDHNIIQCCKNKILISEFKSKKDTEFPTDDKHPYNLSAMVFENNGKDYVICSATYGHIKVIDLETKIQIHSFDIEDVFFYSFSRWNDKYILLNDCLQRRILVLDMKDDFKLKSKVLCPEMFFDKFFRKVDHPIYGESIMTVGIDWKIRLFVNRDIKRENIPETP